MNFEVGKKAVLKHGEVFAKGIIGDVYDPAMALAKEKLKQVIPGQVDDVVIDLIVSNLGPVLKEEILKQVDKLSPEV